jgi:hypothetical protein
MQHAKVRSIVTKVAASASALLLAGAMLVIASGQSRATPTMAQKTGNPCTTCHTTPPTLNAYGKKYKAGGG